VQIDPIKPTLKPPVTKRLKLKYHVTLSNFAFKFNLRRHNKGDVWNFLNGIEGRYKTQCKEFNSQQSSLKELKSKGGLSGEKALAKLLKTPGQKLLDKPKVGRCRLTL